MHPAEFARLGEMGARPGTSGESWVMEQQQQMRAFEESVKASWAAEFGNSAPQQAIPHLSQQQSMPGQSDCTFWCITSRRC